MIILRLENHKGLPSTSMQLFYKKKFRKKFPSFKEYRIMVKMGTHVKVTGCLYRWRKTTTERTLPLHLKLFTVGRDSLNLFDKFPYLYFYDLRASSFIFNLDISLCEFRYYIVSIFFLQAWYSSSMPRFI